MVLAQGKLEGLLAFELNLIGSNQIKFHTIQTKINQSKFKHGRFK